MPSVVLQDEFRINQNSSGVTLAVAVADTQTDVMTFTVPDATGFIIRPGDVFSLTLALSTTEIAGTSSVRLIHTDSNGVIERELVNTTYQTLTEFTDRNKIYTFGARTELGPDERLVLRATGNLAAATAETVFQISTLRGTRSIL
tara:strand:+ start:613 stop:1047 length:435 start_codon:yes stop_codon:yes gene_type:complete